MNTWEVEHAHRIGREIQRLRKAAGLTAQQLGDKAGKYGLKMTRQAISDLENGRRRYITTAELLILAAVLDTAPVALVFPGPYDSEVELLPGLNLPEIDAAEWFSGIEPPEPLIGLLHQGERPLLPHADWGKWDDNLERLALSRALADLEDSRREFLSDHDRRSLSGSERELLKANEDQIQLLKKTLADRNRDA